MSVNIQITIRFNFIFNNTGIEWHVLQHPIKKAIEHSYAVHTIPVEYNETTPSYIYHHETGQIIYCYFKWNKERSIDIICLTEVAE